MRYEIRNDELAIFFNEDEVNVALAHENVMNRGYGMSSGELMYACLVDAINEQTGVPVVAWKDTTFDRPESVSTTDGALVVATRQGKSYATSSDS
jgi:hypothetical protein